MADVEHSSYTQKQAHAIVQVGGKLGHVLRKQLKRKWRKRRKVGVAYHG